MSYGAVVLAGGAGRRLGGRAKPTLPVGGYRMLDRVLRAVADAQPRVVVGPDSLPLPPGVRRTREQPPGAGPVAATAAGLELIDAGEVALFAADLPFLTPGAVDALRGTLQTSTVDGVVFVDGEGRRQTLCGVWRTVALRQRLAGFGPLPGAALRDLVDGLTVAELPYRADGPPPWYDCDTQAELDRAQEWGR